jgi:hypothetical protein
MSRTVRAKPAAVPRPRGAVKPLPDGPLPVPLSTIDWLVSRESPAARFVALRDLLGRPPKDPDLKRAKQGFAREPFVREMLGLLRARLEPGPGAGAAGLERRYDGGAWLALFLTEIGADGTLPLLHHAGDVLLARWEKVLVAIDRREEASLDAPLFRAALRVLVRVGWERDARVLQGADVLATRALAGRGRTEKDLLLFASLPADARTGLVTRAIAFLSTRLLEVELPAALAAGAPEELLQPGFPCGDETDLAEMLLALASVLPPGSRSEPVLARSLARLAARADHRARWKLERPPPERLPVALERTGELSRWVTLRALSVFQHFLGLEVPVGSPPKRRT